MTTGKTKIVGLFGYPVTHSASPEMHNAAFKQMGLNFIYLPFEVKPVSLKEAIKALPYLGIRGVNLTIPHKIKVIPYLDRVSREASITGAVNTVVVKGEKLYGYNTDVRGFIEDLKKEAGISLRGKEVFILGAGGSARAAAVALAKEKAAKINIANRTPSRAYALLKIIRKNFPCVKAEYIPFRNISAAVIRSRLIINATSLGMKKTGSLPIKKDWLNKEKIIYDLVYSPIQTPLLEMGRVKGAKVISGLGMLARQGAMSFYLWTGRQPPLDVMLKALRKAVRC